MTDPGGVDPRPLIGEPLALDLLNTRWFRGTPHDLLESPAGLRIWLTSTGFPHADSGEAAHRAVLTARDAIAGVIATPDAPDAQDALNAVLDRGRLRRALSPSGPVTSPETATPEWAVAWAACENYLSLVERAADRIRRCEGDHCVLYFFDTSRNGTRRWCSMAICGNRAKAQRHYRKGKLPPR
ncbi:CGNR zinc finger domain-containing protein [Nocardiopsis rhodophaea]